VSPDDLRVSRVVSNDDARQFWKFPYELYRHDRNWVPPLRRSERDRWRLERNPALKGRDYERYLARRSGRVVGRVAAIVDPSFEQRWMAHCGFFGFFDCIDDPGVASALLQAVETDLLAMGKNHLLGPVNLTMHDEVGALVDGFGRPTVLTPYNPSYYADLFLQAGLIAQQTYHAYQWFPDAVPNRAIQRMVRMLRVDTHLSIRPVDLQRWNDEVHILTGLYNECFAGVWGFVPMRLEEFECKAGAFQSFLRRELVLIAEHAGRPIGFAVVLPDVHEALRHVNGRLFPMGWLSLALRARRIRRARFILLGVLPDYAGRGVAALIVQEAILAARRLGIKEVEISLIHDENHRISHMIDAFGGKMSKAYCLYGKALKVADSSQTR
jgi:GNAT superfamily N-acetyltransferase